MGEVGHGLGGGAHGKAEDAGGEELHHGEQRHGTARRVLRRVQHVQAEEERRGQSDEIAETQRELPGPAVGDAGHAGHAQDGGHDVEAGGALRDDGPTQKRDDDHVERREERAVGGRGVGEPCGVAPVGGEQQPAQHGAVAQVSAAVAGVGGADARQGDNA